MSAIENKDSDTFTQKLLSVLNVIINYTKPHFKVFFIILIITIIFVSIWVIVKPDTQTNNQIIGVVPYPKIELNIPPDSTQCGTSPQLADNNDPNGPCAKCVEKSGNNDYEPVNITHPNVWYLGTQLPLGNTYCLPKKAQNSIDNCGTYTGKAILTNTDDGTAWKCECLYPDFYNGDSCTVSNVCTYLDDQNNVESSKLTNLNGDEWNPFNMLAKFVGVDPHETDSSGNAIFRCRNCPPGYYNTEDEPYRCQKDVCYTGSDSSPVANFDTDKKMCKCDYKSNIVQSNISGFCFPENSGVCKPHPITGKCTFNIDISDIIFKLNNFIYVSIVRTDPSDSTSYTILVDVTKNSGLPSSIDDMSNTQLKDSFNAYPVVPWNNISLTEQQAITNKLNTYGSAIQTINNRMSNNLNNNQIPAGVGVACNSFFYNHKYTTLPNCSDLDIVGSYETNTSLNKTGYAFKSLCTPSCELTGGICKIDINSSGYSCSCPNGTAANPKDGGCVQCRQDGNLNSREIDKIDNIVCCSTLKNPTVTQKINSMNGLPYNVYGCP
jgi:hypothetical protein